MKNISRFNQSRREVLRYGLGGIGVFIGHCFFQKNNYAENTLSDSPFIERFTPLNKPDENGVRLPACFSSKIVAQSGQSVFNYSWHAAPDGGATFATEDGGWIYVSNSEMDKNKGGVGALKFDPQGQLIDAYSIPVATVLADQHLGAPGFPVRKYHSDKYGNVILKAKNKRYYLNH